ncbi:hypothetical protein EVAR_25600_1 [Eumeta japonica]|uniref:Uncharacterized protein n=1 Tax=Eumeta variegata TaxID=151549 RepID=A0A4C1V265_EUMVA|nr:hypothetical protein EVAR_25600_1 [Eumeta japonica]
MGHQNSCTMGERQRRKLLRHVYFLREGGYSLHRTKAREREGTRAPLEPETKERASAGRTRRGPPIVYGTNVMHDTARRIRSLGYVLQVNSVHVYDPGDAGNGDFYQNSRTKPRRLANTSEKTSARGFLRAVTVTYLRPRPRGERTAEHSGAGATSGPRARSRRDVECARCRHGVTYVNLFALTAALPLI